jgi:hypothetical protein
MSANIYILATMKTTTTITREDEDGKNNDTTLSLISKTQYIKKIFSDSISSNYRP